MSSDTMEAANRLDALREIIIKAEESNALLREQVAQSQAALEEEKARFAAQLEHAKSSVKRQNASLDYSRRHALALERIAAALEVLVKR